MRFFRCLIALIACLAPITCNADVIKQATAYSRTVKMYTTGAASGLTGATLTVNLSQAGAAFSLISPTITEIGNGWYKIALTSGHTNTIGALNMYITATGADPTDTADQVVAYDPADAAALGLSRLDAAISTRQSGSAAVILPTGTGAGQISLAGGLVTVGTNNDKTGYSLTTAPLTSAQTASAVWGDNTTYSAGTKGAQLAAAGSAGDPWSTLLPGSYTSGTAGNLLGNLTSSIWASSSRTLTAFGFPVTVSAYSAGQDPATLLNAMLVDGSLTFKQYNTVALASTLESTRTWNATTHTAVLTFYRRTASGTSADFTKPVMVKTTVYDSTNVQVVSQTITFSNLP